MLWVTSHKPTPSAHLLHPFLLYAVCCMRHRALGTNRENPTVRSLTQGTWALGWMLSGPQAPLLWPPFWLRDKALQNSLLELSHSWLHSEPQRARMPENTPSFPGKTSGAAGGGFHWLVKRHLSVPGGHGSSTSITQEAPANSLFPVRGSLPSL